MVHFCAYLSRCEPVSVAESMELLLPCFATLELRQHAVRSLHSHSAETLALYLPQLLEALRYERNHASPLVVLLLVYAHKSIRFAHKLYWHLRELKSRARDPMIVRYVLVYNALAHSFNKAMLNEIEHEVFMVKRVDQIAAKMKKTKDGTVSD